MKQQNKIKTFFAHQTVRKLLIFLVVTVMCASLATIILWSEPPERTTTKEAASREAGMPVSVRTIEPKTWPVVISALGEAVPLWQTTIKAQVDGKIVFLLDRLQAGNIVRKGELLLQLEKSHFRMQVAEAKNRLASAESSLLKEEQEAKEAQKNWKKSGLAGKPASPLVLRGPQLAVARSEMESARAALSYARTLLGYTDIHAPFDGVVVKRDVNPVESLFAGDEIATLYGMKTMEVGIQLDAAQWALLPESIFDTRVKLSDPQNQATWEATIVRESRSLGRESRLRTIFLQVKNPLQQTPPLLPGTFVRADISGQNIPNLLCIPEAALTKQGIVWFVDSADRLSPQRLEPVFYGGGEAYIEIPEGMERPLRVAVTPNSSFVSGLVVQPIEEKKERNSSVYEPKASHRPFQGPREPIHGV